MREVDDDAKGCWGYPHAGQGSRMAKTRTGHAGRRCDRGGRGARLGQRRHAGASGWLSVSPQETSIPEELMVTVVKPGLPTLADLHVLLPPPRPTRKRSLTSDKVPPAATGPGTPRTA